MNKMIGIVLGLTLASGCANELEITTPASPSADSELDTLYGADSSGGSDLKVHGDGVAWFLGEDRTIQVCIEISPDYPRYDQSPKEQIEKAFAQWKSYLDYKWTPLESISTDKVISVPEIHGGPKFKGYALNPVVREAAIGECSTQNSDLTFYFGVENSMISKVRKRRRNSIAFATPTHVDLREAWQKGYVWITGDRNHIQDSDSTYGLILHELGHVLGCDHVTGTIMDPQLAEVSTNRDVWNDDPKDRKIMLTKIDQDRELIRGTRFDYEFSGTYGSESNSEYGTATERLFSPIFKRPRSGPLTVKLERPAKFSVYEPTLTIGDSLETKTIELKQIAFQDYLSEAKVFKTFMPYKGKSDVWSEYATEGGTGSAWQGLFELDGRTYFVDLRWNERKNTSQWRKYSGFAPLRMTITTYREGQQPSQMAEKDWTAFAMKPIYWY